MESKILNLSAVLGVKENEAGGKADFIEQDFTAGANFAYARGVLPKRASCGRSIGCKISLSYGRL